MTITNKAFRKAMKKAGLEKVQLEKGNGYFYIWSDDEETAFYIAGIEDNSILVNSFNHLKIETWIKEIKQLLNWQELEKRNAQINNRLNEIQRTLTTYMIATGAVRGGHISQEAFEAFCEFSEPYSKEAYELRKEQEEINFLLSWKR